MKKISIISRHAVSNYGSLLQAIALERTISKLGYNCETFNYINASEKSFRLCNIDILNSRWNKNFILKSVFYFINCPNRFIQFHRFEKMRRKALNLSKELNKLDNFNDSLYDCDLFCTGSDQVWNETIYNNIDKAYFLSFTNKKKISYAASFGKDSINPKNKKTITEYLKKYSFISVREDTGVQILDDLGLVGIQVLDPTLLLSKKEWINECKSNYYSNRDYVLLYQIHKNDDMVEYAKKYAKQNNLKILNISVNFLDKKSGIKLMCLKDYKKVLALFLNANVIITDSFHATAFSINLNKNFLTFIPNISSSRNYSILKMFGLEDRIINKLSSVDEVKRDIDYKCVNEVLNRERNKSIEWLKKSIKDVLDEQ